MKILPCPKLRLRAVKTNWLWLRLAEAEAEITHMKMKEIGLRVALPDFYSVDPPLVPPIINSQVLVLDVQA